MIKLPEEFSDSMKNILGDEYDPFLKSLERPLKKGIRMNPLKTDRDTFVSLFDGGAFSLLGEIPWCPGGFYIDGEAMPGRSVYHDMGLFYVQEPSAMAVAESLSARPGERVLDLCAAPGGKTTHIAGMMKGEGLIVSNEIVYDRARVLSQNIERMGVRNCVVTSEAPSGLAAHFSGFFDRVLVDAPCSGEGMFRTKEAAVPEWSAQNVGRCVVRAREIAECAVSMLKDGGLMVYSTCTFEAAENEEMIDWILSIFPEMELCPEIPSYVEKSVSPGIYGKAGTYRIWPHRQEGEGHFFAVLRKKGDGSLPENKSVKNKKGLNLSAAAEKMFTDFCDDIGIDAPGGMLFQKNDTLYLVPEEMPQAVLKKIKVLRGGLELGTVKRERFEPSFALALSMAGEELSSVKAFEVNDPLPYLRGDTIACGADIKGWLVVTYNGFPMGFGKAAGGVIKNHYPKGLRRIW